MKKQPIVFMFSGQGSQYFHMGKELFQKEPRFRYWLEKLDDRTYEITGRRVLDSLYNEKKNVSHVFDCTLDTHPAIFMVEYALARLVMEKGIQPDGVLGSSLGEFAAAAVAGCLSPETALDLVVNQAQSIESLCPKGAMLTVLHSPAIYNNTPLLYENSTIASVNYSSHFVLSGAPEKLREIAAFLQNQLIDVLLLPVTFAYHSPLIDAARDKITEYSKANRFQAPGITFISCVSGKSITRFPADYSWRIARATIRFQEALQTLNTDNCFYLDMGPAGTMANFVKNNLKKNLKKDCDNPTDCFSIMTPYGGEIKKISTLKNHLIPVTVNTGDKKNSSKGMPPIETNSSENNSSKKNTREKKKMKVYMFPGQGAQRKGMGKDLFIEFKELTQKASGILGYSIEELCQEDKEGNLVQTQFTQPALYVVNALSYLKKIQTAPKPDYLLGHSIAEYNALFASGVVDFEEGLKMVQKRGLLMSTAAPGGMAAVMGLTEEQVKEIIAKNNSNIYIANINSPHQIALSGLKENIKNAEPAFLDAGATHYRVLKVSGAFHSPLMEESRQQFENYLKQFEFKNQSIPIISNVTARPHKQEHIRENMIRQITAPVRWAESIRYLLALGIEINDFTELGVKGVSVVKALAIRTNNEAGPLDAAILEAEKAAEAEEAKSVEKTQTVAEVKTVPTPGESSPGTPAKGTGAISVDALGSSEFRKRYNLKYAYLSGGMYKGISSESLVVRMAKAGLLGFFGCSGLKLNRVEEAIRSIRSQLPGGQAFGMNLVSTPMAPEMEANTIDLFLRNGITIIEAAAFMQITPALVRYRAMGLTAGSKGNITAANKLIAKVSRPEVARHFLSPAPEYLLEKLLNSGKISQSQADLLRQVPMADDLCVEADSGGHTDQGMPYALMPSIIKLRDELQESHAYKEKIHVGAAGGIGTPAAAAAAFILGADFVLTGSVNQCTVEAGISNTVKDMLQDIDVQDTEYAPAGDMFEMGAKVQVLKKGVFFPARANKLYDLYRNHNSLDDLNEKTKKQLQERYFKRSFHNVYQDVINFFPPKEIKKAEKNPKHKMALVFRWYFGHSTRLAFTGNISDKVDFQVHCGPALGAFNRWIKDSQLESWKNRHVDDIAKKLMTGTAALLEKRLRALTGMT